MSKPNWPTPEDPAIVEARKQQLIGVSCGPSMADQSARDEVDVNTIMKRYGGSMAAAYEATKIEPTYADVTAMGDFRVMQERILAAREWYAGLPPAVHEAFGPDVDRFLTADIERVREVMRSVGVDPESGGDRDGYLNGGVGGVRPVSGVAQAVGASEAPSVVQAGTPPPPAGKAGPSAS